MRFELTKLAFALAEYRARHGSYPAKLADLVPKYVAAVPQDIFSGGALHYTLQGDGYLLYSVGPNGKDDGGRNREDNPERKLRLRRHRRPHRAEVGWDKRSEVPPSAFWWGSRPCFAWCRSTHPTPPLSVLSASPWCALCRRRFRLVDAVGLRLQRVAGHGVGPRRLPPQTPRYSQMPHFPLK